jgi:hypothetical protein
MSRARLVAVLLAGATLALGFALRAPLAVATEAEEGVAWRLEQPPPPPPPVGVPGATAPIGLGRVGDVEFLQPNLGLLITPGNGSTISPGVWVYNGQEWHALSNKCGATAGRIAWAGPEEFWTVSDGRPGQAANPATGEPAPLADRTLCHFAHGEIVGSYASPAFEASSYQEMHAAGCITPADCWFGGSQLPAPHDNEAFHLHWDGGGLAAEPNPHGHTVEDMRLFEGRLLESVKLAPSDTDAELESPFPFALHVINGPGVTPVYEPVLGLPLYESREFPEALEALRLGADSESLWAAAGPVSETPAGSTSAPVTVLRDEGGEWTQILGPEAHLGGEGKIAGDVVTGIAPEPGTQGAWLALDSHQDVTQPSPTSFAEVARITPEGEVETQQLPSAAEVAAGVGPKGAAQEITCPTYRDCWMTTTQGWLFHLAPEGERTLPPDDSSAFSHLITFRPEDQGLPQIPPDAPPADDSGELPATLAKPGLIVIPEVPETKVREALLSNIHSRLLRGTTTLELSFHLAAKARVQLIAKRKQTVVAKTSTHTFAAGNRKLLLALSRHAWPTKLDLKTHALGEPPLVSTRGPGVNTVGTGVVSLPGTPSFGGASPLVESFAGSLP